MTDQPKKPRDGQVAVCLSGGGYRAMLFHAGALRRLAELGVLQQASRVSSVSGGSIAAAVLAAHWTAAGPSGAPSIDVDSVERQLFDLAGRTIDIRAVARVVATFRSPSRGLAALYDRHLFHGRTLQDLPDSPRFVFNTTNMQTGNTLRWSKPYAADYSVGRIVRPDLPMATVVAASSAFPPFLSPVKVRSPGPVLQHNSDDPLEDQPDHFWLTDGGVYDNLGLQTVQGFPTVFVSDGGAPFDYSVRMRHNWLAQTLRTITLLNEQVGRRRKASLLAEFASGRKGAIWTIGTDPGTYPVHGQLPCPPEHTLALSRTSTRLAKMPTDLRHRLMNWGYASADAAVRSYWDGSLDAPGGFPHPGAIG